MPNPVRLHLYPVENVLRPRGSMKKESLSLLIFEKMKMSYEFWTDPNYGDAPNRAVVWSRIVSNAVDEFQAALDAFITYVKEKGDTKSK